MGSGQSQPAPESKVEAPAAGPAAQEIAGPSTMASYGMSAQSSCQPAGQQKEEREEGEIADDDDDEVQIVSNHTASNSAKRPRPDDAPTGSKNSQKNKRKKARKAQRQQQEQAQAAQANAVPQLNPNAAPFPPPAAAAPKFASTEEKSESKKLVAEFLSWGVGPEYLVGYGISKELIAACLVELNHPIPAFLAHLAPRSTASVAAPPQGSFKAGPNDAPAHAPSGPVEPLSPSLRGEPETPAPSAQDQPFTGHDGTTSTTPRDTPKLPSSLPAKPQPSATPARASLPPKPQSSSAISAAATPSSSKSVASSSQNETRSEQSTAPSTTTGSRPQPDMQAHEKAVRERLMVRRQARQAELAKTAAKREPPSHDGQSDTSSKKHESMQQDIDGLFASAMLDSPSLSRTGEQSSFLFDQPPPPPRPNLPSSVPSEPSVPSTLRPSHHQMATSQTPAAWPSAFASNPARRPKATDFEAEPAAPSAAFVPTARPLFLGNDLAPVSVVIEFDEDDFSSDDEAVASTSLTTKAPSAALNQSSASSSQSNTPKLAAAGGLPKSDQQDGEMKQQLAEKEKEIKAMIERINRMESKTKKKGAKQSPGPAPELKEPTTASTQQSPVFEQPVTTSASAIPASATDSEMLVNAQDQVERLQGEHTALLADQIAAESISQSQGDIFPEASKVNPLTTRPMHVVEEADVEMANDLESSAPPLDAEVQSEKKDGGASEFQEEPVNKMVETTDVPPMQVDATEGEEKKGRNPGDKSESMVAASSNLSRPKFKPYQSSLSSISTSRSAPLPLQLQDTDDLVQRARAALHTHIASRRSIDPARQWCRFEADGGVCADGKCPRLHMANLTPDNDELADFLRHWFRSDKQESAAKQDLFSRGVDLVLQRFAPHQLDRFSEVLLAVYQLC